MTPNVIFLYPQISVSHNNLQEIFLALEGNYSRESQLDNVKKVGYFRVLSLIGISSSNPSTQGSETM